MEPSSRQRARHEGLLLNKAVAQAVWREHKTKTALLISRVVVLLLLGSCVWNFVVQWVLMQHSCYDVPSKIVYFLCSCCALVLGASLKTSPKAASESGLEAHAGFGLVGLSLYAVLYSGFVVYHWVQFDFHVLPGCMGEYSSHKLDPELWTMISSAFALGPFLCLCHALVWLRWAMILPDKAHNGGAG